MLSIGEFSKICKVSTKTLRYYDEIGLIKPSKINQENGYRYYSIEQLETMLFINRLKQYRFSLEEIKAIITSEEILNEKLSIELYKKKIEFEKQIQIYSQITERLNEDISVLKQGKSIMSYLNKIDVQLVEVPVMSYGYLWWIVDENKHIYSAIGNSGNVIYVNPSNNIVIAITSYFKPTIFDRIDFVQKYVEPVISI